MKKLLALSCTWLGCLCSPNVPPVIPACPGCIGQPCGDAGTCLSGHCVDGFCCDSACDGACDRCDLAGTQGTCGPSPAGDPGAPVCEPYLCGGAAAACPTLCAGDSACAAAWYCEGGVCLAKLGPGLQCARDGACASGHCADGVCCGSACDQGCDRCDAPDAGGTCVPVARGTAGVGCGAFICDGVSAACPTRCAGDADCAAGNFCSAAGSCTPVLMSGQGCAGDAQCVSGHCADAVCCDSACSLSCDRCDLPASKGTCTVADAGRPGAPSCGAYVCAGDSAMCPSRCAVSSDCAAGFACSSSTPTPSCLVDGDGDGAADVDDCAPGDATRATLRTCYGDGDGDGFISAQSSPTCSGASCPSGTQATPGTDCNDSDGARWQLLSCALGADNDSDGYHAGPGQPTCSGGGCPDGGSSLADCDDDNAQAHPGQRTYFSVPRDGGSYDYDCSGGETRDPSWDCVTGYPGTAMCQAVPYTGQRGYVGAVPGCGDAGVWRTCASWEDAVCGSLTWWYGACGLGCAVVDGGSSYSVQETTRAVACH